MTTEKPIAEDLCLIHFPLCEEEPFVVAKFLGEVNSEAWGHYLRFQWYGRFSDRHSMRKRDLAVKTWKPCWLSNNAQPYWADQPVSPYHGPFTNEDTYEWVLKDQVVTWGFELQKNKRLPTFVVEKANLFMEEKSLACTEPFLE